MEEKEDAFFCGEVKEKSFAEELKELHLSIIGEHEEYLIEKAQKKLDRISDSDFVRLWQSETSLFDFLEELQDRIGCVFSGTEMLRCIGHRANQLRRNGVRIQTYTI